MLPAQRRIQPEETDRYALSRRTLREWPIRGDKEEDLCHNVVDFFRNVLLMTAEEVASAQIEKIDKVKLPSSSHIHDEIRVLFREATARDNISSKGRLLATYHDPDGRPQAGFRMDIPDYLAADYKLLNDYGYRMKRVHGKETRKFVKFDEAVLSLILELKLPGDLTWLKITPSLARDLKKEYEDENIQRLCGKLTARPRLDSAPLATSSANWVPLGIRSTSSSSANSVSGPSLSQRNLYPNKGIPSPTTAAPVLAAPTLQLRDDSRVDRQTWRPQKDAR